MCSIRCLTGLPGGQRLAGADGPEIGAVCGAAEPRRGHDAAGVERRDRPVRAQCEDGAGLEQVAAAPGPIGPLVAEAPGPVVAVVGAGVVGGVAGLHGGDDAQFGEARYLVRGQCLDVLDPVPDGAASRDDLSQGVQDVLDGGVADGVGGGLDSGLGQDPDRLGIVVRVLPVGVRGLAVAVGLVQPGRAAVDGAVDEQLDRGDAP